MFDKLDENKTISSQLIMALKQYLIFEEYESDTIKIDIDGNIYFNLGRNKLIIFIISDFIKFCKCMYIHSQFRFIFDSFSVLYII